MRLRSLALFVATSLGMTAALAVAADDAKLGPTKNADVTVEPLPDKLGWVATLPGSCTGAPVLADLDADGRAEIVVPVIGRDARSGAARHPRPSMAGQLFAFRADGTPVPGWPVVVVTATDRRQRNAQLDWWWNFSPSVADVDKDGTDELVLPTGGDSGTAVVDGKGRIRPIDQGHGDPWGTAPLVDLDADGSLDVVMGWTLVSTTGRQVTTWPGHRLLRSGYAPAVGDFLGTGTPCVYHPHYGEEKIVGGYDHTGQPLPGWPVKIRGTVIFVSAGDLDGNGTADCVAADMNGGVYAWRSDGAPLLVAEDDETVDDGMFDPDSHAGFAAPAIADVDLNTDARPEIVLWDTAKRVLTVWRANGTRLLSHPLPDEANARGGVSVGDVGADGLTDLFVGTTRVTFDPRTGKATNAPLLPGEPHPRTTSQPTICDADGDGNADILVGTTDGRLIFRATGERYDATRMQWPTQSHDFRHTGLWTAPGPRPPARP